MKIYLDYIFLENIIVNLIVVYQINIFTKTKPKIKNIILSSVIMSIYTCISYIYMDSFASNIIVKIMAVSVVIYIAFIPDKMSIYIKEQAYYYLISFFYVGIIISISLLFKIPLDNKWIKITVYLVSSVILYIFNRYMWKVWKSNIKKENLTYIVNINGQEISAFVDTGNNVYDYINSLDVFFVESIYKTKLKKYIADEKTTDINFNTVSGNSYLKGYIVEDISINKGTKSICNLKKAVIVFVDKRLNTKGEYNALISYETYVEKMKGVTI